MLFAVLAFLWITACSGFLPNKNFKEHKDVFPKIGYNPKLCINASCKNSKILAYDESINSFNILKSYGGDFAGHSATFDPKTGKLICVPEHLVPESMIEWGAIPSCLEVITSENVNLDEMDSKIGMDRYTVSIMPDVGCGVDNLDTTMKKSMFLFDNDMISSTFKNDYQSENGDKCERIITSLQHYVHTGAHSYDSGKRKIMFETTFCKYDSTHDKDSHDNLFDRVRVQMEFIFDLKEEGLQKCQMIEPVTILSERKTSNISTNGEIAKGGGLDGRTVTRLIGKEEINNPFTERIETVLNSHDLLGSWNRQYATGGVEERMNYVESAFEKSTSLYLPLGIVIIYDYCSSSSSLTVEVSKVFEGEGRNRIVCGRNVQLSKDEINIVANHWIESFNGAENAI